MWSGWSDGVLDKYLLFKCQVFLWKNASDEQTLKKKVHKFLYQLSMFRYISPLYILFIEKVVTKLNCKLLSISVFADIPPTTTTFYLKYFVSLDRVLLELPITTNKKSLAGERSLSLPDSGQNEYPPPVWPRFIDTWARYVCWGWRGARDVARKEQSRHLPRQDLGNTSDQTSSHGAIFVQLRGGIIRVFKGKNLGCFD